VHFILPSSIEQNKTDMEPAVIAVLEVLSLWRRARIPTRQEHHIVVKLISLLEELRTLLKGKGKKLFIHSFWPFL